MSDYSFDLHRIFIGDLPGLFYVEIMIRTAVMFLYALVLIRMMGKRSLSQLSAFDFVIIIALGSAVGDPMFYEDVPLFYGMIVVAGVVALERALAVLTMRSRRIEAFVDSTPTVLVEDGIVDERALAAEFMSDRELHEALRNSGVDTVEAVKIAVLEPSGKLSVRELPFDPTTADLWDMPRH